MHICKEMNFLKIICHRNRLTLCNSNKKVSMCREGKFLTRHDLGGNFAP